MTAEDPGRAGSVRGPVRITDARAMGERHVVQGLDRARRRGAPHRLDRAVSCRLLQPARKGGFSSTRWSRRCQALRIRRSVQPRSPDARGALRRNHPPARSRDARRGRRPRRGHPPAARDEPRDPRGDARQRSRTSTRAPISSSERNGASPGSVSKPPTLRGPTATARSERALGLPYRGDDRSPGGVCGPLGRGRGNSRRTPVGIAGGSAPAGVPTLEPQGKHQLATMSPPLRRACEARGLPSRQDTGHRAAMAAVAASISSGVAKRSRVPETTGRHRDRPEVLDPKPVGLAGGCSG